MKSVIALSLMFLTAIATGETRKHFQPMPCNMSQVVIKGWGEGCDQLPDHRLHCQAVEMEFTAECIGTAEGAAQFQTFKVSRPQSVLLK